MIEILGAIAAYIITMALSWGVTVGIIKLITLCFGWEFSLLVATGVWLALLLIKWAVGGRKE